jgi:hypothetical protein
MSCWLLLLLLLLWCWLQLQPLLRVGQGRQR